MKKIKFMSALAAGMLLLSLVSCDQATGKEPETPPVTGYKAGDVALSKIKINGVEFDKTAEVYVTGKDGATIVGTVNALNCNSEGVFVEGRKVSLSPFIMGKYEVTQELYTAVMTDQKVTVDEKEYILEAEPFLCKATGDHPLVSGEVQPCRPVENVNWYDAVWFCNALSEKLNLKKVYNIAVIKEKDGHIMDATVTRVENANGYRLPTEAEWEFVARGGDPKADEWVYLLSGVATFDEIDYVGWHWSNRGTGITSKTNPSKGYPGYGTHEVGKKASNSLGIYDMTGNVFEWTYDLYEKSVTIKENNEVNPVGAESGSSRVIRGGSWRSGAGNMGIGERYYTDPDNYQDSRGFRVVRSAE